MDSLGESSTRPDIHDNQLVGSLFVIGGQGFHRVGSSIAPTKP
jgi:hypothetical protein